MWWVLFSVFDLMVKVLLIISGFVGDVCVDGVGLVVISGVMEMVDNNSDSMIKCMG